MVIAEEHAKLPLLRLPTIRMSIYTSIHMPIHVSIHTSIRTSINMPIHISIHMPIHTSIHTSIHMPAQARADYSASLWLSKCRLPPVIIETNPAAAPSSTNLLIMCACVRACAVRVCMRASHLRKFKADGRALTEQLMYTFIRM